MLAAGMVAWGTKKLTQKDVQSIEKQTGKSYEDLNDAEIQQATAALNIQAAPLDPAEQAQVQQAGEFEEVEVEEEVPD